MNVRFRDSDLDRLETDADFDAGHSPAIAVASDRMVTGGIPVVEFEHEGSKIEHITDGCVALTAGSALVGDSLFKEVRTRIGITNGTEGTRMDEPVSQGFRRSRKRTLWDKGAARIAAIEAGSPEREKREEDDSIEGELRGLQVLKAALGL